MMTVVPATKIRVGGFTLGEIKQTGFCHGEDGADYYPPSLWGLNASMELLAAADKEYKRGYQNGKREVNAKTISRLD